MVTVDWDDDEHPYLVDVQWTDEGLIIAVQSRDQRELAVFDVDPFSGATSLRWRDQDDAWVELVGGVPRLDSRGQLVDVRRSGRRPPPARRW